MRTEVLDRKDPGLTGAVEDIEKARSDAQVYRDWMLRDDEVRFCWWAGQSEDGRKRGNRLGSEPEPWEGASDTRIRLADAIIQEQVDVMMAAWQRGKVQTAGTEAGDIGWSQQCKLVIDHLLRKRLRREIRAELARAANLRQAYGLGVLGVFWRQRVNVTQRKVSVESLLEAGSAGEEGEDRSAAVAAAVAMVLDPTKEDVVASWLEAVSPLVSGSKGRRLARELRVKGEVLVPVPEIVANEPMWRALRPWVDVFWPVGVRNLQESPWVAWVEYPTETDLRGQAEVGGWDEEWVEEAVKRKGQPKYHDDGFTRVRTARGLETSDDVTDRIEVVRLYRRGIDRETGLPAVYCTVFCPAVQDDLVAKHEPLEYAHREYPFIPLVREPFHDRLCDSRGVSEIVQTHQDEVKVQRDARADRTQIATLPPAVVPVSKGASRLRFGPGAQHTERRPGEIRWMQPPPFDQGSLEIEKATQADVDRYFGRFTELVPPSLAQLRHQGLVDAWLEEVIEAARQTMALARQYLSEDEARRIIGPAMAGMWGGSDDEIRGSYDVGIEFDVRDLDTEYLAKKAELIAKVVLPMDTFGLVDRAALTQRVMSWVDPALAGEVIRSQQAANNAEIEAERLAFTQMASGIEPDPAPEGSNFGLRLQVLMGTVQKNPELQARLSREGIFRELVEARAKQLQFGAQQVENAMTGRIGAERVLQ